MNIITFDTEEWYIEKKYNGGRKEYYAKYYEYQKRILDLLDERGLKATFFCVGGLAREFPQIIREIDERGHEVGCHSDQHSWLTNYDREGVYKDTKVAIDSLEDVLGKKIVSYRAPAFSIGEANKWAFEVLAECGIERDASIFPASRDFGGFSGFPSKEPCLLKVGNQTIKEFPVCLTRMLGKEFAFSGGGYFRFFPLSFIKHEISKSEYVMCYFHIGDLLYRPYKMSSKQDFLDYYKVAPTFKNRFVRMSKSSIGTRGAFDKMKKLVSSSDFVHLENADQMIDWNSVRVVEL